MDAGGWPLRNENVIRASRQITSLRVAREGRTLQRGDRSLEGAAEEQMLRVAGNGRIVGVTRRLAEKASACTHAPTACTRTDARQPSELVRRGGVGSAVEPAAHGQTDSGAQRLASGTKVTATTSSQAGAGTLGRDCLF
jgi:hypothetical protein